MRRVFLYAMQHDAIAANPLERVDFSANRSTGDREKFTPHPLTASQVADVCAALAVNVSTPMATAPGVSGVRADGRVRRLFGLAQGRAGRA